MPWVQGGDRIRGLILGSRHDTAIILCFNHPMNKKTKRILWALLILAVLGGGGYVYHQSQIKVEALAHETVAVRRATIEDTVSAQGKLEPKDYVDVGVQVSGQLKKLYVEIGDVVKAGDLIAELDPQVYQSRVAADEAKLAALRAQLAQQEAQAAFDEMEFARAEKLIKTKAISQQEWETKEKTLQVSKAAVDSNKAQIAEAEANLKSDQINLGYTKIFAPIDGIVSDQIAREGQTLNANQTTPTIVQIANLDIMTIRAQIAEADVMKLKSGMESRFSTLGSLDKTWTGTIRQILPTPEVVNDVVLYNALIDVENKQRELMNGMSTQNSFAIARADEALVIPMRALGRRLPEKDKDGAQAYQVQVLSGEQPVQREIMVGLVTRSLAEVKTGLAEGEKVLVQNGAQDSTTRTPGTTGKPRMPGGARL